MKEHSLANFVQQKPQLRIMIQFRRPLDCRPRNGYSILAKAVAFGSGSTATTAKDRLHVEASIRTNHENPIGFCKRRGPAFRVRPAMLLILRGALLSAGFRRRLVGFTSSLVRRGARSLLPLKVGSTSESGGCSRTPPWRLWCWFKGSLALPLSLQEAIVQPNWTKLHSNANGAD